MDQAKYLRKLEKRKARLKSETVDVTGIHRLQSHSPSAFLTFFDPGRKWNHNANRHDVTVDDLFYLHLVSEYSVR